MSCKNLYRHFFWKKNSRIEKEKASFGKRNAKGLQKKKKVKKRVKRRKQVLEV